MGVVGAFYAEGYAGGVRGVEGEVLGEEVQRVVSGGAVVEALG